MNESAVLDVVVLGGLTPYAQAWALQQQLHIEVAEGRRADTLLLLEHPPTYTVGRRGTWNNLRVDAQQLRARGFELFHSDRGGDITYHGPGQLVGYPIVMLSRYRLDVVPFVRLLEQCLICVLEAHEVRAQPESGLPGVWCGLDKIAAIGVRVSKGVSMHGVALNVFSTLEHFSHIVPCGLLERGVCSVESVRESRESLDPAIVQPGAELLATMARELAERFAGALPAELRWRAQEALPEPDLELLERLCNAQQYPNGAAD